MNKPIPHETFLELLGGTNAVEDWVEMSYNELYELFETNSVTIELAGKKYVLAITVEEEEDDD